MKKLLIAAALVATIAAARAQMLPLMGIGAATTSGSLTPCAAGALDLSLTTGCNIPFFLEQVYFP